MPAPAALTFLLLASPSRYLISWIASAVSPLGVCDGEGEDTGIVASSKSGTGGLDLCSTPSLLGHPVLLPLR